MATENKKQGTVAISGEAQDALTEICEKIAKKNREATGFLAAPKLKEIVSSLIIKEAKRW